MLLDDLRGLDISGIVNARGSISAAVNAPGLQSIVTSGAASSALGGLGSSLTSVLGSFGSPEAMIKPVSDAVSKLGVHFDPSHLPISDLSTAVRNGLQFVQQLTAGVSGDPADFGKIFGTALGDAVKLVGQQSSSIGDLFGPGAGTFNELLSLSSSTRDPGALAEVAIEVLLPIPKAQLKAARDSLTLVLSGAAALQLPSGRASGLVSAFDAVTAAAESGDAAALQGAIANLTSVRSHMLGVLRDDLAFAQQQLAHLRVAAILEPVARFAASIRLGEQGAIEFLSDLRRTLVEAGAHVDHLDFGVIRAYITALLPQIESRAVSSIEAPIDEAVERAKNFIRGNFRRLPIRQLRNEIIGFLHKAAAAIDDANLDGPANAVRNALDAVANALDGGVLAAGVQHALQQVADAINAAVQPIINALQTVGTEVNNLAAGAEAILDRVTSALEEFQKGIDQVSASINALGIDQAEQQMVQSLDNLRKQVQTLTSNVPLPEPLRPQVEQLISLLEGIDLDQMLEPVRQAVAELKVPPDIADVVTDGLGKAKEVIDSLIPQQLIASIQAEIDQALDTLRGFNPASLLPDVSQYLNDAAEKVEQLDPRPLAEQIHGPFQTVLDAIDRVHPSKLLQPVIDVYDAVFAAIPVPDGETLVNSISGIFDAAGGHATQAVGGSSASAGAGAPGGSAGGAGSSGGAPAGGGSSGGQATAGDVPPSYSDVHVGDAIRLLGFIPAKLREALMALEAGSVGTVMTEIDSLCGGLARQIRTLQTELYAIAKRLEASFDDVLAPLGPASLRAHMAVQLHFGSHASMQASLNAIALAGPGGLRGELAEILTAMRSLAHEIAAAAGGSNGASLDRLATALESSPLAQLASNADQFLAALDPEPLAAELDAFADRMLRMMPQIFTELADDFTKFVTGLRAIITHFNPGAQAQKFLTLLDVLRDEIDVLNPHRLVTELAELHGVIRAAVAAYDPRAFADEIAATTRALAQQIRALNSQELLGDTDFLGPVVAQIENANPANALSDVGQSLTALGDRLGDVHLDDLISSVNDLGPKLETAFEHTLDAVKQEIIALLESLKFATGSASVSVSAGVG